MPKRKYLGHRKHRLSITKTSRLMQFKEIVAVDNHAKHLSTLIRQNAEFS
jgi:hypothetical protein